jgi:hypothetical protein
MAEQIGERAMYVSIRRYRANPEDVPEIVDRVREGFVPIISKIAGFVSYQVLDTGDGFVASISTYDTKEAAQQSNETATEWVRDNLTGLLSGIPDVTAGEIILNTP